MYSVVYYYVQCCVSTVILVCVVTAVGVAHQAVEEISPEGDSVLIMGTYMDCTIFSIYGHYK